MLQVHVYSSDLFRRLAEASWVVSTMSNSTALLITLLYWTAEFKGGVLTFADFFQHAFQVSAIKGLELW